MKILADLLWNIKKHQNHFFTTKKKSFRDHNKDIKSMHFEIRWKEICFYEVHGIGISKKALLIVIYLIFSSLSMTSNLLRIFFGCMCCVVFKQFQFCLFRGISLNFLIFATKFKFHWFRYLNDKMRRFLFFS